MAVMADILISICIHSA